MKYVESAVSKFKEVKDIIAGGFIVTKSVAEDCDEANQSDNIIKDLRDVMLDYSKMEREISQYCEAANQAIHIFEKSEREPNLYNVFEECLEKLTAENTNAQLEQNKEVTDFMQTIWTQHYGSQSQEELTNVDDEIEMTQFDETKFICPITKTELVYPMKSKLCGHTFSKQAVESHINQRKDKAKCPIPGCIHGISLADLEPNNVIAFEMRKRNRKV